MKKVTECFLPFFRWRRSQGSSSEAMWSWNGIRSRSVSLYIIHLHHLSTSKGRVIVLLYILSFHSMKECRIDMERKGVVKVYHANLFLMTLCRWKENHTEAEACWTGLLALFISTCIEIYINVLIFLSLFLEILYICIIYIYVLQHFFLSNRCHQWSYTMKLQIIRLASCARYFSVNLLWILN